MQKPLSKTLFFCTILLAFNTVPSHAQIEFSDDTSDLTPQEKAWLESEPVDPNFHINHGELTWVLPETTAGKYRLQNHFIITPTALKTGWVTFTQCHFQLDAIRKVEVIYHPKGVRNLQILSSQNIVKSEVVDASLILSHVTPGGKICVSGETKSLFSLGDSITTSNISETGIEKVWEMKRGPYMRKFLDGYYPLHVKETLEWQGTGLILDSAKAENEKEATNPRLAAGKHIQVSTHKLVANYHFEGRLKPKYVFMKPE